MYFRGAVPASTTPYLVRMFKDVAFLSFASFAPPQCEALPPGAFTPLEVLRRMRLQCRAVPAVAPEPLPQLIRCDAGRPGRSTRVG